jgi:hypothetical protein
MNLKKALNKRFVYPNSKKSRVWIAAFIGLFVFLFLSVFQPFNLWNVEIERRYFVTLGYGAIVFMVLFLNHKIANQHFRNYQLTLTGFLFWYFLNTSTIALFSSIFNDVVFNKVLFTIDSFFKFQFFIFVTLIIPTIILFITISNNRIKKTRDFLTKQSKHSEKQEVVIHAENSANDIIIDIKRLLYITSFKNYVTIFYLKDLELKESKMRSSLKSVEEDFKEHPNFIRCHKGYIVNMSMVNELKKDFRGSKLLLSHVDETIPVSRDMVKTIREKLMLY